MENEMREVCEAAAEWNAQEAIRRRAWFHDLSVAIEKAFNE